MAEKKYLMVASLQIGRTYSNYAFSTRHDFMDDPLKIHINPVWNSGSSRHQSISTPTCLLLDKDKEFLAFGYDAENRFAEVMEDGEIDDHYFFQRFTTLLHINEDVTDDMIIKDVTGKTLPASEVFKLSIKYLASHLIQTLDKRCEGVRHDDLQWVLAVPSSWTETAKHIMKLSAERAGIQSDNLVMVPESDSAFVYGHSLWLQDSENYTQDNGDYMVVDLGGIAADITVFKYDNYQLIQRFHTTGNDCGGRLVNKHFSEVLAEILGEATIKCLKEKGPLCWLDIEREFESIKRGVDSKKEGKFNVPIPIVAVDEFCRKHNKLDFESLVKASKYVSNIKLFRDKMRIDADTFRNLFKSTIDNVISLIERVFIGYKDSYNVTHIIMAGGFSDCSLVQDAVKQKFPSKHIIITEDASMVVAKGSVLYGHQTCQYIRSPSHQETSNSILTQLSQLNRDDFKDLVASGTFATYANRIYLAGPCNIGKSSLASILIGEKIPKTWFSTDGLIIHFGRNGIDLQHKKMVPLKKGNGDVFTKLILGSPKVKEQQRQSFPSKIKGNEHRNQDEVRDFPFQIVTQQLNKDTNQLMFHKYQKKQQQQQTTSTFRQIPVMRKVMPPKHDPMRFKVDQKRPIYTAQSIQDDVMEAIKNRSYNVNIAPSDLVDFGGQKSFDMTHQLFIQHKGTFILMFDGRHGLHTKLHEYPQGNVTAASILEHWINSVLTYCNTSEDKMPRIVFAATHSDEFSKNKQEKLALKFQEELTTIFSSHKLHEHIMYAKVFFINATDVNDLNIDLLKDALVDIAFHQSTWGQRMPIVWVPLDLLISDLREDGTNLITKESLWEMNRSNDELALSKQRFEDFLIVQHSIGKILYFDEPALRDFIVIQPTAMVNILRAFITDRVFWPKKGPFRDILENLSCTGVIQKTELFALWSQPAFKDILTDAKTKEYIVQVLLHLDILVEPKRYSGKTESSDLFLVPCIVRETIPAEIQENATGDKTMCLAFHLKDTIVPSAFSFKVIGATISNWPLKAIDSRYCLYFQSAVMDAGNNNELQIHVKGQRIVVYLINEVSKQLISPDLATTTQECLTLALGRILQFYRRSSGQDCQVSSDDLFEIEVGEICKGGPCFLPVSDAIKHPCWRCINEKTHETKCLLNWVFDKNKEQCDHTCKGLKKETLLLTPNDQHFVQLARKIGIADFYNFFIYLGMTKSDYDNLNFRYFSNPMDFMLMGLFEWRDTIESRQSTATLKNLLEALTAIERQHYLCQVHREDHSLLEKAHTRLQDVPSDHVIRSLVDGQMIGDCVVHLGVELGLSIRNIKETMYNFPKDLNGQISNLLLKWKTFGKSNKSKPTIYRLMVALQRVTAAEGLVFLKKTYGVE